jgi:DUF4097 and DUF4098 domain-containing protein YvlB
MGRMALLLATVFSTLSFVYPPDIIERDFRTLHGKTLTLTIPTGGNVDISGWNRNLVSVRVVLDGADGVDCKVAFQEHAGDLTITSRYAGKRENYNASLRFIIKVPHQYNVNLQSNGGDVLIENVEGTFTGTTAHGVLNLRGVNAKADLTTGNGAVSVRGSRINGSVKTLHGYVIATNVSGNMRASSFGNNQADQFASAGPIVISNNEVSIRSTGGDVEVQRAPNGTDVNTRKGNIHIKSADRYVKAQTTRGDITIGTIDGWVQAATGRGDVRVQMVSNPDDEGRDVEISSLDGNITLIVPRQFSMDIDITIAYTQTSRRSYKVASDFKLTQSETRDWINTDGTPTRFIRASGSHAGGRNRIIIKTVNGDVTLKRG